MKTKTRNAANFKNPKTIKVIRYLELCENRISRKQILEIANKDIFYQLKNEGYIASSDASTYKGTSKLIHKIGQDYGESFGRSSSPHHSERIYHSSTFLPKQVLLHRNFNTGQELEEKYSKFQRTDSYQTAYQNQLTKLQTELDSLHQSRKNIINSGILNESNLHESLCNQYKTELLQKRISILQENPVNVPDYCFHCSYTESLTYISNLTEYKSNLNPSSKEYQIYEQAIHKMNSILSSSNPTLDITWSIEIITNSYASIDIERHQNYEILTGQPVIYLM